MTVPHHLTGRGVTLDPSRALRPGTPAKGLRPFDPAAITIQKRTVLRFLVMAHSIQSICFVIPVISDTENQHLNLQTGLRFPALNGKSKKHLPLPDVPIKASAFIVLFHAVFLCAAVPFLPAVVHSLHRLPASLSQAVPGSIRGPAPPSPSFSPGFLTRQQACP